MKSPKIIFFPGFAEDERAFSEMLPYFSDFQKVVIDYQTILGEISADNPDLYLFSKLLIEFYDIQKEDILIGHSFGGWAAVNVQIQSESLTVSIGSFIHPKKPRAGIIGFNKLGYWLIMSGFFKWRITHWVAKFRYKKSKVWGAVAPCLEIMKTYSNLNLLKITKLIAHQPPVQPKFPMLRFHAIKDQTVAPPDEHFEVIEGDHFIQHTQAEKISTMTKEWMKRNKN